MKIGFIGFGLMGQKRAKAVAALDGVEPTAVFDVDPDRAASLSAELGYEVESSPEDLLAREDLDVVVLAVPHQLTRDYAEAAFAAGKHVFCEKPVGRNPMECLGIIAASEAAGKQLGVGFNYRHYPGIQETRRQIDAGTLGDVTHARFVLGHAARPGYEKEWKTSRELCGGGALLDPGIHVLDVLRYLLGSIEGATVELFRSFWNLDIEDNVFANLRFEGGRRASAHVSITEWRNEFALDVFGTEGTARVRGRSGFYGRQTFEMTKRWSWLSEAARAEEFSVEYPLEDDSFRAELEGFFAQLRGESAKGLAGPEDALAALRLIDGLYQSEVHEVPTSRSRAFSAGGVH